MSRKHHPILANERTAAALLDMTPAEFSRLVGIGALPPGREIVPGMMRWDTDQLRMIGSGDLFDGGYQW
jgi:hypothetical protein